MYTKQFLMAAVILGVAAGRAPAQTCAPAAGAPSYALKTLDRDPALNGYRLNVNVNGGKTMPVLVDTGSNLLILPYFTMGGFPQPTNDQPVVLSGPSVKSGKLAYGYGSSGNGYQGYLVQADVVVNPGMSPQPEAKGVIVYAVTETCKAGQCQAVMPNGNGAGIGMMGVGFQQLAPTMTMTNGQVPTNTNILGEISGLQNVGYIFRPDGIVVGLNAENTSGVTWYPLDNDTANGAGVPRGCFTITPPGGTAQGPLCGTMLFDTGLGDMYLWQNGACPSNGGGKSAGFAGVPFTPGTKITVAVPDAQGAAVNYSFAANTRQAANPQPPVPGTPNIAYCSTTQAGPHSNVSRMPLQLYSYYRNQSCNTYGFTKN